jgi:hypothetical protein
MLTPNLTLTETQALLNLTALTLNAEITEAYYGNSEAAKELRRILTIDPKKETVQTALLKMLNFHFNHGLPSDQSAADGSRIYGRATNIIQAEVRIKPGRKRVNGVRLGYYQIVVPHFLPDKWPELRGYTHTWGELTMIYAFQSKRQIKINVKDEGEGHRIINQLLKTVDPAYHLGKSEKHSYKGFAAPDKDRLVVSGLTGKANRVSIEWPDRQLERHQL